jgi:hypothetical protein
MIVKLLIAALLVAGLGTTAASQTPPPSPATANPAACSS